jgi:transposase InsO family protein
MPPTADSGKQASNPFDLIHADLVELPIKSYHKNKWACMLMDNYSSFAYCFLLQSKDKTFTAMKQFLELVKTQHNRVIKQFCFDQGGEFKSKKFDDLLASKGIVRQTSAPHIHQQNGRAEHLNDTILEKAESM